MNTPSKLVRLGITSSALLGSAFFPQLAPALGMVEAGQGLGSLGVLLNCMASVAGGNVANAIDAFQSGGEPDWVSLENEDLTRAVGKAIASVLMLVADTTTVKPEGLALGNPVKANLRKVANDAADNWLDYAQREDYSVLGEENIEAIIAPASAGIPSSVLLSSEDWKNIFVWLNLKAQAGGGFDFPPELYDEVAQALTAHFPKALLQVLKEDFAKDGGAYAALSLRLLTGLRTQLEVGTTSQIDPALKADILARVGELEAGLRAHQQETFRAVSREIQSGFREVCQQLGVAIVGIDQLLAGQEEIRDDLQEIKADVKTLLAQAQGAPAMFSASIPSNLPFSATAQFIGRQKQLAELKELIDSTKLGTPILISGIPGVGKSELIRQYAFLHQRDFEGGLVWVKAENLGESLLAFMQQVKLDQRDLRYQRELTEQVAEGWRQWYRFCTEQAVERRALVMVEDVTDYQRQVMPFLPSSDCATPFRIVLTSRSQWRGLPTLELWQLEPEEAEVVLRFWAGDNPSVQTQPELVTALCERLGYLPLALTLAGSWLSESERTLSFLLTRLEQEGLGAAPLSPDPADIRQQATMGVKAMLELSWQGLTADAQQLGRVLSLFANADLQWEWAVGAIEDYGERPRRKAVHLTFWQRLWQRISGWLGRRPYPRFIELPFAPIAEPLEAKLTLRRSNWLRVIDVDSKQWIQIHRLLYEFLGQQGQEGDPAGWGLAVARQLTAQAERIPAMAPWEVVEPFQPLRSHLEHILGCWPQLPETPPKQWRNSIDAGAFRLHQLPLFETTLRNAITSHDRAKEALKVGDQALAQQYFTEARDGYQRAVDQARIALPNESGLLAGYLYDIADFLREMGQYRAAIAPAWEAVAIVEKKDNPQKLARYLIQLGIIYKDQGEYLKALPLLGKALEIDKEQLGERHPDTATSYSNLAGLYYSMGRYEEALPLYELALEIRKEQLGDRHLDTATSYNNLASLYKSMGRYEEALPLSQLALEICKEQLGDRHPDTASSYNNLAGLYRTHLVS